MSGIKFRPVDMEDANLLFDWRRKPHVDDQMAVPFHGDWETHIGWLHGRQQASDYLHWMIETGGRAVGVLNFQVLDFNARSATWGLYIGEEDFLGFGGLIPPFLYNEIFLQSTVQTLRAEVVATNEAMLKLHDIHGYVTCAAPAGEALKNRPLTHLQLTRDVWIERTRYHRFRAELPGLPTLILNIV